MVFHVALNIPKNKNKYFRFENISEINVSILTSDINILNSSKSKGEMRPITIKLHTS